MPRININEIDNTIYNMSELTNNNIVYVPGSAITGPYDAPVLLTTTYDYENQFGATAPEGSPTHNYVEGLLRTGLPVLFRRIVASNQDSDLPEVKVSKAETTLNYTTPATETPKFTVQNASITVNNEGQKELESISISVDCDCTLKDWSGTAKISFEGTSIVREETITMVDGTTQLDLEFDASDEDYAKLKEMKSTFSKDKVTIEATDEAGVITTPMLKIAEKYGGTYGNSLSVTTERVGNNVYLKVYFLTKQIENIRVASIGNNLGTEEIKQLLFEAFQNIESERVDVEVLADTYDQFEVPYVDNQNLTGGANIEEEDVRKEVSKTYSFLTDKYIYDIKFLTSGGYTDTDQYDTPIANAMVDLAEARQDCLAIPDLPIGTPKDQVTNFFVNLDTSYAAAFAPWAYIKLPDRSEAWMAPSYIFLYTLGRSIEQGNPVYLAPAGVLRASISQLVKPEYEIGGDILENWQSANPQCINPIMKLRSYGYVIYGQKTLYNIENSNSHLSSALQELNTRLVVNEIKKAIFDVAVRLTFQSNNQKTWNEFIALLDPTLNSIKLNGGITDYRIKMDETTTTEEDITNNTIRATVRISVSRAVENFEIDFVMEPQSIVFEDEEEELNADI